MRFSLNQFEDFLKSIDLQKYRNEYAATKIVELDLPKNIQALKTMYEQYWDNKDNNGTPLSFEEYYDTVYFPTHKEEIYKFWHTKSGFGTECDCFLRGLKARIYRTWASLITQIHGGYVAEKVFGAGTVEMGEELDRNNIDFKITTADKTILVQVKKKTNRKEIARMDDGADKNNNIQYIRYEVPTPKDYENPYYKENKNHKANELKPFAKNFVKFNPFGGTLDRFDNGFVVFTDNAFKGLI